MRYIFQAEPSGTVEETAEQDSTQEVEHDVEHKVSQEVEHAVSQPFQYKPSERLKALENELPAGKKEFVPDGKVREIITSVYQNAMQKNVAKEGLNKLNEEWKSILEGPEASRVIGTCGQNFAKIVSSDQAAEVLDTVWTTAHLLLSRAGKETKGAGLGRIMESLFTLFGSPQMPKIISQTGELIIKAANKNNAVPFVKSGFDEIQIMLKDSELTNKINTYFKNMVSMMKNLNVPKRITSPLSERRRRRR